MHNKKVIKISLLHNPFKDTTTAQLCSRLHRVRHSISFSHHIQGVAFAKLYIYLAERGSFLGDGCDIEEMEVI